MSNLNERARRRPQAAARALGSPRPVIRGETHAENQPSAAHVDWIAFTFVLPEGKGLEWIGNELHRACGISRDEWRQTHRGWQGYLSRIDLGEWGILAFGGMRQRGTIHVSLNAHGCSAVPDWKLLREFGQGVGARITRLDLAHDDFDGSFVTVDGAMAWYRAGGFNLNGRPSQPHLRDDLGTGTGRTFYVGKRENGKVCRVYEKGKQLGDPTSPWCRVEVELRNKDRVIPWETLTDPGPVLAGSYPCLASLCANQSKLKTVQRIMDMSYSQMVQSVKHLSGRALNVMLDVHQGDTEGVLIEVVRSGKPKRLSGLPDVGGKPRAMRKERP